jgi:hypothetical protein
MAKQVGTVCFRNQNQKQENRVNLEKSDLENGYVPPGTMEC